MATYGAARAAKEKVKSELSTCPEVNGVGVARAEDGWAIKVNLTAAASLELHEVDGVPVRYEVVGPIRKRQTGNGSPRKPRPQIAVSRAPSPT